MFNWIKEILGFKEKIKVFDLEKKTKINENFYFRVNLIESLTDDHKNIIKYYLNIQNGFSKNSSKIILENLSNLNFLLRSHFLKEDNMLYLYLQSLYANDSKNLDFIKHMKTEMMHLEPTVFNFLTKYSQIHEWNNDTFKSLENDMKILTPVLLERIQNEESKLYSLYKLKV
jgi:hemerythrin-like domain-containing protein